MKLSECKIGLIVKETKEYIKRFGGRKLKRKIGWIKDIVYNAQKEVILLVKYPDDITTGKKGEECPLHPCHVEIYEEE